MKIQSVAAIALSLAFAAPPVLAEWLTSRPGNVRFNAPDGWIASHPPGVPLEIHPPAGGVSVEFYELTNAAEVANADAQLTHYINSQFDSIHITRPAQRMVQNGLHGAGTRGTGMHGGQQFDWFAVAMVGDTRGVVIVCAAAEGHLEAQMGTLTTMLNSIQPAGL